MNKSNSLLSALIIPLCSPFVLQDAHAQIAPISDYFVSARTTSGPQINSTKDSAILYTHLVRIEDAASFQIKFGRTKLAEGTQLRMTSFQDGATQHLNATTLEQWRNKSAWFNGSTVLVELIAKPNTRTSHVTIDGVMMIEQFGEDRSICGDTDDRVLSYENRDARAIPIGCTAWIIDDSNHTLLTAGHCAESADDIAVVEFNVPLSDSNGNIQHPGPEDQYASDPVSLQSYYSQIGDDWAYFGCFPNTETGLTPYQAQDDYYVLSNTAPIVKGQDITICGFGVTYAGTPATYNQAQKIHTGPYAALNGTAIGYQTDTSGGNSGSAVLNEATGEAIGIHTNAGCSASGGENWGCAIHNSGLQNALANPQGVCIPNILIYNFPYTLPYDILPNITTAYQFEIGAGEEQPIPDLVKVVLLVNGNQTILNTTHLGGDSYEVTFPTFNCDDVVDYYFKAQGDGGTIVYHPYNAPGNQHKIVVGEIIAKVAMTENFDDGIPSSWTASGLWTSTTSCMPSGECDGGPAAYFGLTSSCTYDDGSGPAGSLMTPAIPIDSFAGDFTLSFCSAIETENLDGYDDTDLYINGALYASIDESANWQLIEIDLTGITGNTIQIEWRFDAGDKILNDFRGWHVDGVQLVAQSIECDDTVGCVADITGDSIVNVSDLLLVIDQWGNANSPADITGDGIVNVSDLLEVVGNWGECP